MKVVITSAATTIWVEYRTMSQPVHKIFPAKSIPQTSRHTNTNLHFEIVIERQVFCIQK